jgi:hypothetical protein
MSLSGHFNSKWVKQDKLGRDIKTHEDFRTARIKHDDGSFAEYRGGKMVPGSHVPNTKNVAKNDVASEESRFYKPTPITTIVERTKGETETAGDKDTASRVRKKFDVNARSMKL